MGARALLIVLDGFGIGKDSPFNAITNAKMPFYRDLLQKYPHSELLTHGEAVGLPEGVMGNSEVGHMTMGSGQVLFQSLARINRAIKDKALGKNPTLIQFLKAPDKLHFMGLLSDGGVHSHISHLEALLDLAVQNGRNKIFVHAFMDGRDTPPNSGSTYLERLLKHPAFQSGKARVASFCGRYFAMDRDKRWERTEEALKCLRGQIPVTPGTPLEVLKTLYTASPKGDEFLSPTLLESGGGINDNDAVLFFNFRADRARQISQKLATKTRFLGMTVYDEANPLPALFEPEKLKGILAEVLENEQMRQFRIAETEKYAHVTFFFNGGREKPFNGEDRLLINSPKDVATYDLKPEMSAPEVAREAAGRLSRGTYDFVLMNFANADMVGHTGNYEACVRAMEALDRCIGQVIGAATRAGYTVLLTADHGNAEEMCDDEGRPHTQHTLNPVPAILIEPSSDIAPKSARKALRAGGLADVMPTLCDIMKLKLPPEVSGRSLL